MSTDKTDKPDRNTESLLARIPSNVQFIIAVSIIYFCYGRSSFVQERMYV